MFKFGSEKTGQIAEKAKNQSDKIVEKAKNQSEKISEAAKEQSDKISETARKQSEKIAEKLEEQIAALKALVVITELDATDENAAAEHLKDVNNEFVLVTFSIYLYQHH